jgi:hypothetical protein
MKKFPLISILLAFSIVFNACNKDITAPEQSADGSNVVYLKIDDKEEFLLDARSKIFHKNTASNIDEINTGSVARYAEENRINGIASIFTLDFSAEKPKKAEFQEGYIKLELDKSNKILDSSFVRKRISGSNSNAIIFLVDGDNPRKVYVDSIIDYKVIKWDTENKIFTFSANGTYNLGNSKTPANPRIYFYFDIKY